MSLVILQRKFFEDSPVDVARNLVGKILIRKLRHNVRLEGVITETEAYGGENDPASHAFHGRTKRNSVMFEQPGRCYVYFSYGFHHCLNFVTGRFDRESAGAVLIRAIEPTKGIRVMSKLRGNGDVKSLTNGPGKLCQALSIDLSLNGCDVTSHGSPINVGELKMNVSRNVFATPRIGIRMATDRNWRFIEQGKMAHLKEET